MGADSDVSKAINIMGAHGPSDISVDHPRPPHALQHVDAVPIINVQQEFRGDAPWVPGFLFVTNLPPKVVLLMMRV